MKWTPGLNCGLRRGSPICLAILVTACGQPATPPRLESAPQVATANSVPAVLSGPAKAPRTLAGEWRVAGIDGASLNEPYGLALRADARKIWWEPICAHQVRGYSIDGGRFRNGPDPDLPKRGPGEPTLLVCTIGLPPRLATVMRSLDSADTIALTPENGVLISGGGHSLLLFSQ